MSISCPSCQGSGRVDPVAAHGCDGDCDCDDLVCYRCGGDGIAPPPAGIPALPRADERRLASCAVTLGLHEAHAAARRCDLFDAIRSHPCQRQASAPAMKRCPKVDGASHCPDQWCPECRAVDPAYKAYRNAKGAARKAQSRLRVMVRSLAWRVKP